MSVPTTLRGTHDGCGGTVVFRPATHRRELLAGRSVTLTAACQTCGATLSTEWALPQAQSTELAWQSEFEQPSAQPQPLPLAAGAEGWHGSNEGDGAGPGTWRGSAVSHPEPAISSRRPARALSLQPDPDDDPAIDLYMTEFSSRVAVARESLRRVSAGLPAALETTPEHERFRAPRLTRAASPLAPAPEPTVTSDPAEAPESVATAAAPAAPVTSIAYEPQAPDLPPPAPQVADAVMTPVEQPAVIEAPQLGIAPTDDDVFPPVPADVHESTQPVQPMSELPADDLPALAVQAAPAQDTPADAIGEDAAGDVWAAAPDLAADDVTFEHAGFVDPDSDARTEEPGISVAADPDRGFDWEEAEESGTRKRRRKLRRSRRARNEITVETVDAADAAADEPETPRTKGKARKAAKAARTPKIAKATKAPTPRRATGAAPQVGRTRIGLVGIIVISVLAMTCGIAMLKLVQSRGIEDPAASEATPFAPAITPSLEAGADAADPVDAAPTGDGAADAPSAPPGNVASSSGDGGAMNGFADAAAAASDQDDAALVAPSDAQEPDPSADTRDVSAETQQ